jgi:hypothetical protein
MEASTFPFGVPQSLLLTREISFIAKLDNVVSVTPEEGNVLITSDPVLSAMIKLYNPDDNVAVPLNVKLPPTGIA